MAKEQLSQLIAEAHPGVVIVLTDGERRLSLMTNPAGSGALDLDLDADSPELAAELLKSAQGPFTPYSRQDLEYIVDSGNQESSCTPLLQTATAVPNPTVPADNAALDKPRARRPVQRLAVARCGALFRLPKGLSDRGRYGNRGKVCRWVKIILPALINDPDVPIGCRVGIRHDSINLVQFQRCRVVGVIYTHNEPG